MSKLIIVESPGKIKKIKSFLGAEYNVMASVGHIRDLAKDSISVDPNNNFKPTYEITSDKKKIVAALIKAAKVSTEIIIASDGDREGEAIAQHLVTVLKAKDYKRIIFYEITKNAIIKALQSPTKIDSNMFLSQQTRRILDRIVGYKLSPILKTIPNITSNSLGAGRVQSVVTRLIVDKEREIDDFLKDTLNDGDKKSSIYLISGDFIINNSKFKCTYIATKIIDDFIYLKEIKLSNNRIIKAKNIKTIKIEKTIIDSKDQIKFIIINIRADRQFQITKISNSDRYRHPPQPFITSTLQQESSYKLKFQLKKTMSLAQKLYEKGLITYMRTDSPSLSSEALGYIKKQILEDKDLGEIYYQYRQFKAKGNAAVQAQEAHEAIRPTHFNVFELEEYDLANTDEEKLYQLIWNRSVASQMKSAKYHDQHLILSNTKNINFEGTNSVIVFDGYLRLYLDNSDNIDNVDNVDNVDNIDNIDNSKHIKLNDHNLKSNRVTWSKINFKESYSSSPSRYNEPSLVKKLESLGIGRPSTYANIISKLQEHKYIKIGNIEGIEKKIISYFLIYSKDKFEKKISIQKLGSEKFRLIPTPDGKLITDYLIKYFPQIMDYKFTIHMENLLDEIANGNKIWYEVLSEFYQILKNQFTILGLNIESTFNKIKQKSEQKQQIIGSPSKYGDIIYMETKYGPAFKVNIGGKNKKDIFVGAGNIKITDINIKEYAIKYIDYKIQKIQIIK